jgi:hypothetical protein
MNFWKPESKSKLCCDHGQSANLSCVAPHLESETRFLLLSASCGFIAVGRPLWREDGLVVYNCCWPSLAQSFSGLSPAGIMTIFCCLRFHTPPTRSVRQQSGPVIPPGTEVPFRRLLRLAGLPWRYSNPPPHGGLET